MFAGSPLPCLRSQMRVAVTSWIFSDGRSLLKCNNCQRYLNLNELLRLCWGNNVMMENRKGGWGCTFGPMMIVDGWWQSPARATPVNIGHMAPDACVGVGSGQWLLIEVCGKKIVWFVCGCMDYSEAQLMDAILWCECYGIWGLYSKISANFLWSKYEYKSTKWPAQWDSSI